MRTLTQSWSEYSTEGIAEDAPDSTRKECRRAYYAGALAMLTLMAVRSTNLKSAKDLMELEHELDWFAKEVAEGRA